MRNNWKQNYKDLLEVFESQKEYMRELEDNLPLQRVKIADVIAMLPFVTLLENVNRVEVIDQNGRSYVNWKPTNKTEISLQDEGRTLKIFISNWPYYYRVQAGKKKLLAKLSNVWKI